MPYDIVRAPAAVEDFLSPRIDDRAAVREALEAHHKHAPTVTGRSRIKRPRYSSRQHSDRD